MSGTSNGIKNWTVISKRIIGKSNGMVDYASYLISSTHKNHKNTTVLPLFNFTIDKFIRNTLESTVNFDSNNTKGGRKVESYCQSYDFILPAPLKPTPEQWKAISLDLIKTVHSKLGIKDDVKEYASYLFMNIHDQTNPHINMLVPRIYKGEWHRKLDQKSIIMDLKKQFNLSVLKHCDIDFKEYKPQKPKRGNRRSAWQRDQDKAFTSTPLAAREVAEAAEATAKAQLATAQAQHATTLVEAEIKRFNKFQELIMGFTDSLFKWINSVRSNEYLGVLTSRSDLVEKANKVIESDLCSDVTYNNINQSIETGVETLKNDGFDVEKPEVSKRLRRGFKP